MTDIPKKAFILAAGFGTRLRPHTDHRPKPMVEVAGRTLIWRALDKLRAAGIEHAVVNTHYMADVLEAHLNDYAKRYPDITIHISHEDDILDTGGGVKNALSHFGDDPFFVIAGDALWSDGRVCALTRLAHEWAPDRMDILTLMQPISRMTLTHGVGDFDMRDDGRIQMSPQKTGAYMWTNIRLNSPQIYKNIKADKFSFLDIMKNCEQSGRFIGLEHDGEWHHISTPDDLEAVDAAYQIQGEDSAA